MALRDTNALTVETTGTAESLPAPAGPNDGRTHLLVNTSTATVTWSAGGGTPFLEDGSSVSTITIARGQLKMVQSNGTQWVVAPGGVFVAPIIQSAHHANAGTFTLAAAADGATGGRFWLINPVGSGIVMDVRKVWVNFAPGGTPIVTPPTTFNLERVTFTGTASGATVAAAVRDTANPAAAGSIRTASTGLVLTAGAAIHSFVASQMVGTLGINLAESMPVDQIWPGDTDTNDFLVLRPGQGIVFRQATAGAAVGENRTARVDVTWDERI